METSGADQDDATTVELPGPLGVALGATADALTRELVDTAMDGAAQLGVEARIVRPGDDQSALGALLGIGYQGSFLPIFASPPRCRRIIWVGETLRPSSEMNRGVVSRVARSDAMEYLRFPLRLLRNAPLPGPLARARASGTIEWVRARNLRDMAALAGRVDRVVVTSRDRRAALAALGLDAVAIPFGYAEASAGPIAAPGRPGRDLAIVTLARLHPRMVGRQSVVHAWQEDEPRLRILENVWGHERNGLLRRSKVVLNVSRTPGDFIGLRLILALAAGAVVVTEPLRDPFPFVPGEHFVEATAGGLLDAARDLVADEPRRRRIAEAGQALLTGELTIARCLGRVLSA